ncbi:MAG: amidohydrolase [Bacteroidetes bacterium]|nr:MAG: amidohydrolase [Bacteroidota bacterium]
MKKILFIGILGLWFQSLYAQNLYSPAKKQSLPILLQGGTIHIGNGKIISNGEIRFENGKIVSVSEFSGEKNSSTTLEVINTKGKHIYPGLILINSFLGLNEIEAVRQAVDANEIGDFNANVRSLIAYNAESNLIPTMKQNGILIAQVAPQSGLLAGTSSIMQLDAWNWEDAAYKIDDALHINFPAMYSNSGWWAEPGVTTKNDKRSEVIAKLDKVFNEALAYSQNPNPEVKNLNFEAMRGLFDGSKKLFIRTDYGKEIIESVQFFQQKKVKSIVVFGGRTSFQAAAFLKENNIPLVIEHSLQLPERQDDDIDLPYKQPFLLQKAGVQWAMTFSDNLMNSRNLPFSAGIACGYGLSQEEALTSITLSSAKILGIDHLTGSLEVGKDANIVVSEGDILDMRTNKITESFIQGRKQELRTRQTDLYQKYKNKFDGK